MTDAKKPLPVKELLFCVTGQEIHRKVYFMSGADFMGS